MSTHPVRILSITIDVPFEQAYEAAHPPEFFSNWAAGLASSLHHTDHGWVANTPAGEAKVAFTPRNDFGILDHHVVLEGKPEIYIPLRMIANGDGTEVEFTLFRQPDMDDAAFEVDAEAVEKDLATLKKRLEGGGPGGD